MTKIDIIIPCYGYGHFLRQCAESVLSQSFSSLRVLIIDDASPDSTAEMAAQLEREDARVSVIRHTVNCGHIFTYNEGLAWAQSDYLLLLSADDYLLPGALETIVRFMDTHEDVGLAHGACLVQQGDCPPDRSFAEGNHGWSVVGGHAFLESVCATTINPVETAAAFVRTRLQKELGGYYPELSHSGDFEMWMRFATRGAIGWTEEPLAVRRFHGRNMSVGYYATYVEDYVQRRAAFDTFFAAFGARLPDGDRLHQTANGTLAEQMFWTGIGQICRGNNATGRQLLNLSCELRPAFRFFPPLRRLMKMPRVRDKILLAGGALAGRVLGIAHRDGR
jgi:glycosyltransferase involved in cell wall biosynthesis